MAKCKDCIHYDLCLSHPTLSYSCLDVKEQTRKWFKEAKDVVEVKHGFWKKEELLECEPVFLCSICEKLHDQEYSYCNNCGAKMDLEEII